MVAVKVWREDCWAGDCSISTFSNMTVLDIFNQTSGRFPAVFVMGHRNNFQLCWWKQNWIFFFFFMRPGVLKQNMNLSWPEPRDFPFSLNPTRHISTALSLQKLFFLSIVKFSFQHNRGLQKCTQVVIKFLNQGASLCVMVCILTLVLHTNTQTHTPPYLAGFTLSQCVKSP